MKILYSGGDDYMFNKKEIRDLRTYIEIMEKRLTALEEDWEEYADWKKAKEANREAAAKEGYFFLNSKADTVLLEKVISEINNNEDLTALFRTSDGATLSLRVHKQPINELSKSVMEKFNYDGVL